jgi:L-malate glycosyltransferase
MRILVFSHEYPPVGGGGGRVAQDLCQGLAARGHQVRVLTARLGDQPEYSQQQGVEVYRLDSGRREPFRADLRAMAGYLFASFWAGWKMAREWKPDVLHVHFAVPAGPVAWLLHRLTGIPYVLTAHLGDVPGGTPEKTGRWFRWIYPFTPPIWRAAAQVVAVSGFTRQLALKHYRVPIRVIYNGVDLQALDPGEICAHEPARLVFAGRLMQQKNPLQVVRVLAELCDLPWTCTVLGDGPLRAEVEAEIDKFGLRGRITLTGWVSPEEVLQAFRSGDILFLPSFSEGLPVVGVQALAFGLALVVSRVGGWLDLVKPGQNGFVADPEDREGFRNALASLLCDRERLLSYRKESRAHAAQFEMHKIICEYEDVLTQAAKGIRAV